MEEIQGQSVLILGYGREGKSVHKYLRENHPDKQVDIADQEGVEKCLDQAAKVYSGSNYLSSISQYDTIVRSPGITLLTPELQAVISSGKHVTSATNIFFANCPGTVIGITGTKGKSTTSTLIYKILSQHYQDVYLVGNIGNPTLDCLANAKQNSIFVVELSSYQLYDLRYSPYLAVVLNIVPDHLDYHGGFINYVNAKANLVKNQTKKDLIVVNPNHPNLAQVLAQSSAQKYYFSSDKNTKYPYTAYVENGYIVVSNKNQQIQPIISLQELPLLGEGNLENILAATTVGNIFQVPSKKICTAIKAFKPLRHRLELIGEYRGIRFYDDSIATVPEAAMNAIEAFADDVETLIVGGNDRGLDFSDFGTYLVKKSIKTLILFPDTGARIWQAVCEAESDEKMRPKKYDVVSMKEATKIAYKNSSPGKVCLFSPASPRTRSLFSTFDERGDLFRKFVIELGESEDI